MTDPLKIVNLYIETDFHGPRRQDGTVMYLLEAQTSRGTRTRDKIIPIPDTTEHHLVLEALEEAMGRINQSCQVEVWLWDYYIARAIDGGLVQQWMIRDWRSAKDDLVTDADLWKDIAGHLRRHVVTIHLAEHHGYRSWMQDQLKKIQKRSAVPVRCRDSKGGLNEQI